MQGLLDNHQDDMKKPSFYALTRILEVGNSPFPKSTVYGGFLKWWVSPTTIGFPTKNDQHLGWRLGVPPFKETPIYTLHLENPKWPLFWLEAASCGGKTSDKWLRDGIYASIIICSSSTIPPKTLGKVSKCLMCFCSSTTTTTTTTTGGLAHLESATPFCQVSTRVLGFVIWSWLTSWSKLHDDILANSPEQALPFVCFGNL